MTVRFGFIPVKPGFLLSEEAFNQIIGDYVLALEKMGGERWSDKMLGNQAPLVYLIATGGTEEVLLKLRAERSKTVPDEPVLLLAHPANNSLPASLEVLARLQQDGERGRIFYLGGPDDEAGFSQIETAVQDMEVYNGLKRTRIGLVGAPSEWLVASSPDPTVVEEKWGTKVVPIDVDEITRALQTVPSEAVASVLEPLVAGAAEVMRTLAG